MRAPSSSCHSATGCSVARYALRADFGFGCSFVVRRYQYVFAIGAGCSVLFVLCVVGIMLRSATATVKAGKTQ